SYILLPLLSAGASAIGHTRSILLKPGFIQPPVIWTGIIGRSGQKKSPALTAGCMAVTEHERVLVGENEKENESHERRPSAWWAKDREERGNEPKPKPPVSKTCLMDDMTLEALADTLEANARGV